MGCVHFKNAQSRKFKRELVTETPEFSFWCKYVCINKIKKKK